MDTTLESKLKEQAEIFGLQNGMIQAMEECAELTQSLCKLKRFLDEDATLKINTIGEQEPDAKLIGDIAEEIADVEIVTEQLKHLLDIKNVVIAYKTYKLNRTEKRLLKDEKQKGI